MKMKMKLPLIKNIVNDQSLFLPPDTKIIDAMGQMQARKQTCAVIIDGIEPVGIITESDALGLLNESFNGTDWGDKPVSYVMTSPVTVINWELTVIEAINITNEGRIRNIPVINDFGEAVGVVNHSQMLHALFVYCRTNGVF